jgi:multiple sugar transport system permease protein
MLGQSRAFKYFLLAPALLVLGLTTLYPFGYAFVISLRRWQLNRSVAPEEFVGLANYLRAFSDAGLINSVVATVIFTLLSVSLSLLVGGAIALLLFYYRGRFGTILKALLIFPFAVSPALKGYSWRFMLNPSFGVLDQVIDFVLPPLKNVVWLGEAPTAMFWLAFTEVWGWGPFIALVFIGALGAIDDEIIDAAKVDGANNLQIFWRITLPLLTPIILIVTLLKTITSLKMFDQVVTLTGGGPGRATQTINHYIYTTGFKFFDMGYASALAFLLVAVQLVFAYFYIRVVLKAD